VGSGTSSEGGGTGPRRLRAAIRAVLPPERYGDHLTILAGTGQNVLGLVLYGAATVATQVLISRVLGAPGLGLVTLATQAAFVAGAATRFGMDMAAVRRVAIEAGRGSAGRARAVTARAAAVAASVSLGAALGAAVAAEPVAALLGAPERAWAFRAAALGLPFVALAQVYLGATRGLKVMRHTLWIFWAGQPTAWLLLTVLGWVVSRTAEAAVVAYGASWALATGAAWWAWERETAGLPRLPAERGEVAALVRYGAPRAPAALLSQLLFWADYFVLARFVGGEELGVYAAVVRVGQALMLLLVAVNYMFSPFVADLHARGERDRLDRLYKALSRWVLAGTLPLLLVLAVVPGSALRAFGPGFEEGATALRIVLVGQLVNVAVGGVGFILVMVGRTGWDLVVYALSFALDVGVAAALAPRLGAEGAAVAQALTMVVSNLGRLYLVWRFVRVQPFGRAHLRLLAPAAAAAGATAAAHAFLREAGWGTDLAGSAAAGTLAYLAAMAAVGLTGGERAALRAVARRSGTPGRT
jgi:O-antigen/teichoic acid export membrane protein